MDYFCKKNQKKDAFLYAFCRKKNDDVRNGIHIADLS
jgi:hypothetical protein